MERKGRAAAYGLTTTLAAALLVPLAAAPSPAAGSGSVSLTALGVAASEPFDSLATSGTTNVALPTGWFLRETGTSTANNDAYAASTGSATAGDVYSFGSATTPADRAFGTLQSGTLVPTIGAAFTNNTGSAITRLDIAYTGEQWRLGALPNSGTPLRGPDRLDFEYSLDATSLSTGSWTAVDDLDFISPAADTVGAKDGNAAANRTARAASVSTAAIAPGATFWVRWLDFNPSNADDGLAVDEFSLTPRVEEVGPTVAATTPANGTADVALDANVSVTFSEPVDVVDPWFTISCTKSGSHAAVATGGPTVFSLDPAEDFESDESCTVTVLGGQVTDQDTEDPPNAMAANAVTSFVTVDTSVCGDPTSVFIHDVQGDEAATPRAGALVTIEAVVVGDYQGPGQFSGYYLQEEDGDADEDPLTSEGLFVANTSFAVKVGDKVRVRGRAGESNGQTQLSSVTATLPCAEAASVTAASTAFPVDSVEDLERLEGMSVSIDQELTVTEVFTLARFGEVDLSVGGRLENPTNEVAPGAAAAALQDLNNRSRILLDDGNNQQNIDPTLYPQGGLSAANTLRVGDTLPSLGGVLGFGFGRYRVQPVGPIEFDHTNSRPESPAEVGGDVRAAAFNVLNYFNGDGAGGGFPTARGANTLAEFERQRAKIVAAITELDAAVVGLMELENDATAGDQVGAIEDLVDGLNEAAGGDVYDFVDTGVVGTDAIRVGILYQPGRVTPVGGHAIINSTVDPRFVDTLNRPSIAQTFEVNASGAVFTAVVNHLKSKGSDCNAVGDPDTGDGQGNCNITRTNAAEALVDWLDSDPTGSGDADFLVLGDMNAYAQEDPITVFRDAGYVDTIDEFLGGEGYSFVFQGQSGYLDHALASPSLAAQVAGVTEWHINADEPIALDYNVEFKSANQVDSFYSPDAYRSSDHDPVLVGLDLNAYDFSGFFPPLANLPALNSVKAGSGVPIKFSLGGDQGLDVLVDGTPTSTPIDCVTFLPTGPAGAIDTSGGLTYRGDIDTYILTWKTVKAWTGTCRLLTVELDDGTVHEARFLFTK